MDGSGDRRKKTKVWIDKVLFCFLLWKDHRRFKRSATISERGHLVHLEPESGDGAARKAKNTLCLIIPSYWNRQLSLFCISLRRCWVVPSIHLNKGCSSFSLNPQVSITNYYLSIKCMQHNYHGAISSSGMCFSFFSTKTCSSFHH